MTKRKTLSVIAGTLIVGVRDAVRQARSRIPPPDKRGIVFIDESRSFGRFICEVPLKEDRLVSARYQQND